MSAYHKALRSLTMTGLREARVECVNKDRDGHDPWGKDEYQTEYGLDKRWFMDTVREGGWTYDENGNWLCPVCSKGGE